MTISEETLAKNTGRTHKPLAGGGGIKTPQVDTPAPTTYGDNIAGNIFQKRVQDVQSTQQVFNDQVAKNVVQNVLTGNIKYPEDTLKVFANTNSDLSISEDQARQELAAFSDSDDPVEVSSISAVTSNLWSSVQQSVLGGAGLYHMGAYELSKQLNSPAMMEYAKEGLALTKKRITALEKDPNTNPQYSLAEFQAMRGVVEYAEQHRDRIPAHLIDQLKQQANIYGEGLSKDYDEYGYSASDDVSLERTIAYSLSFVGEALATGGTSAVLRSAGTKFLGSAAGKSAATQAALVASSTAVKPAVLGNLLSRAIPSAVTKTNAGLRLALAGTPAFRSIAGGLAVGAAIKTASKQATVAAVTRTPISSGGISGNFLLESMDEFYADGGTYSDLTIQDKMITVVSSFAMAAVEHIPLLELLGPVFRAGKGGLTKFFDDLGELVPTNAKSKELLDSAVKQAQVTGDISPVAEIVSTLIDRPKLVQLMFRSATARSAALASSKFKEQAASAAISTVYGVGEEIGIEAAGQVIGNIGQRYGLGFDQNILDIQDTVEHLGDITLSSLLLYGIGFSIKGSFARAVGEGHTLDDLVADSVAGDFTTRFKDTPITPEVAKAAQQAVAPRPIVREVNTLSIADAEAMGVFNADRYSAPKGVKTYNIQVESETPDSLDFSQPQAVVTVERSEQDTSQAIADRIENEMPKIAYDADLGRFHPTKIRDITKSQGMAKSVLRLLFDAGHNESSLFSSLRKTAGKLDTAIHPANSQNYSRALTSVETGVIKGMLGDTTDTEITEYVVAGQSSGLPVTTTIHGSAVHKAMEDVAGVRAQQFSTVGLNKAPVNKGGKRLVIANPTQQQLEIKATRSRGSKGVVRGSVFSVMLNGMFAGSQGGVIVVPTEFEATNDMLPKGWKFTGEVSMPDSRTFKNSAGSKALQVVTNQAHNIVSSESRNLELSSYKAASANKPLPIVKDGKIVGWTDDSTQAGITSFADYMTAVRDAVRNFPLAKPDTKTVSGMKFAIAKRNLSEALEYLSKAHGQARQYAADFYSKNAKISDRNVPVEVISKIFGEGLSNFYQTPNNVLESGLFDGEPILVRDKSGKVTLNKNNVGALVSYMYDAVYENTTANTGDMVVSEHMVEQALNWFIHKDPKAPPEVQINSKLSVEVDDLRTRYAITDTMANDFVNELAESSFLNSMIDVYPELRQVQTRKEGHSKNQLMEVLQKALVPFKNMPVSIPAYFAKHQSGMFFNNLTPTSSLVSAISKDGKGVAVLGSQAFGSTHPINESNSAREQLERLLNEDNTHLIVQDAAQLIQNDKTLLDTLRTIKNKGTHIVTVSSMAYNGPVGLLHDLMTLTKPRGVRLPKSFNSRAQFVDRYAEAGEQVTSLGHGADTVWTVNQSAVSSWSDITTLVPHISNIGTFTPVPKVIQPDSAPTDARALSNNAKEESISPIMTPLQSIITTMDRMQSKDVISFAQSLVEGGRDLSPKLMKEIESSLTTINIELSKSDALPTFAKPLKAAPTTDSTAVDDFDNTISSKVEGKTSKLRASTYKKLDAIRGRWEAAAPTIFQAGAKGDFQDTKGAANKAERINNQRKQMKRFLAWNGGKLEFPEDPFTELNLDIEDTALKLEQLTGMAQAFDKAVKQGQQDISTAGIKAKEQIIADQKKEANVKDPQAGTYIGAIDHLKLIQIQEKLATLVKDPTTSAIYIPVPQIEHRFQSPTNTDTKTTEVNAVGMLLRYAPDFIPGVESIDHKSDYSVATSGGKQIIIGTPAKIKEVGARVPDGAKIVLTHPRTKTSGYHSQVKSLIDSVSDQDNSRVYPLANQAMFGLEHSMYESLNYTDPSKGRMDPPTKMAAYITAKVKDYRNTLAGAEPQLGKKPVVEPMKSTGTPILPLPPKAPEPLTASRNNRDLQQLARVRPTAEKSKTHISIKPQPVQEQYVSPATKEGPAKEFYNPDDADGQASRSFGGEFLTKQEVQKELTDRFGGVAPKVKIVDTVADVPSRDIPGNAAGYWLKPNDQQPSAIYLVASNITKGDSVNVLLHEVVHELVASNDQSPNSNVIDTMINEFLQDPKNLSAVSYIENAFGPDSFRGMPSTEKLAYVVQVASKLKLDPSANRTLQDVANHWVKNILRIVLNVPFEPSIDEVVRIANEFSTVKVMNGLAIFNRLTPARRENIAVQAMAMNIGWFDTSNTQANYYGIDKVRGAGISVKRVFSQTFAGLSPWRIAAEHKNDSTMADLSLLTSRHQRRRATLSNRWNKMTSLLDSLSAPQRAALGRAFNESTQNNIPLENTVAYKRLSIEEKEVAASIKAEYDRTASEVYHTLTGVLNALSVTTDPDLAVASDSLLLGDDAGIRQGKDVAELIHSRVAAKHPTLERGDNAEYANAFKQEQEIYSARLKALASKSNIVEQARELLNLLKALKSDSYAPVVRRGKFVLTYVKPPTKGEIAAAIEAGNYKAISINDAFEQAESEDGSGSAGVIVNRYDTLEELDKAYNRLINDQTYLSAGNLRNTESIRKSAEYEARKSLDDNPIYTDLQVAKITELIEKADAIDPHIPGVANAVRTLAVEVEGLTPHFIERNAAVVGGGEIDIGVAVHAYAASMTNAQVQLEAGEALKALSSPFEFINKALKVDSSQDHMAEVAASHETTEVLPARRAAEEMMAMLDNPDLPGDFDIYKKHIENDLKIVERTQTYLDDLASAPDDTTYNQLLHDWEIKTLDYAKVVKAAESGALDDTARKIGRWAFISFLALNPSSAFTSIYTSLTSASYLWATFGVDGLKNATKAMKYMRLANPDTRNWREGRLSEVSDRDGTLPPRVAKLWNILYHHSNVISQSYSAHVTQTGDTLLPTGGLKRGATNVLDTAMTMYLASENYTRGHAALAFLLNEEQNGMYEGIDFNNQASVDTLAAEIAVRIQAIVGDYNPATQGALNHPWFKLPTGLMSEVIHHLKKSVHTMAALYNGGDGSVIKSRAHAAKMIGAELMLITPFLGVGAVASYKFVSTALGWAMTLFKDDEDQHIPDEVWMASVMRDFMGDNIYDASTNGLLEQIPYWLLGNSVDISGKFELNFLPYGFHKLNTTSVRSGLTVAALGPAGALADQGATIIDLPNAATAKEALKIVLESGLLGQTVRRVSTTLQKMDDGEVSTISGLITIFTGFQDAKLARTREVDFPYIDHQDKGRAVFSRAVDAYGDYKESGDVEDYDRMVEYADKNALLTNRRPAIVLKEVRKSFRTRTTKKGLGGAAPLSKTHRKSAQEQKDKRGL